MKLTSDPSVARAEFVATFHQDRNTRIVFGRTLARARELVAATGAELTLADMKRAFLGYNYTLKAES